MKEQSCTNEIALNDVIKGLQVKTEANIPAFHIAVKTYSKEIPNSMIESQFSKEDYLKMAVATGGGGTFKLNVVLIDAESVELLENCTKQNEWQDVIHSMFCITSDDKVALKVTYV
jgi:hypothetical protein